MLKLTNEMTPYIKSMGKFFELVAICETLDEANQYCEDHEGTGVICDDQEGNHYIAKEEEAKFTKKGTRWYNENI